MPDATPMFITRDPVTGAVTFEFAGHIHAQGLDLDAGTNVTPPTDDRIRWLDTGNGLVVAEQYAYRTGGASNLLVRATQELGDVAASGGAALEVADPTGTEKASVGVGVSSGHFLATADAEGQGVTMVSGTGGSSFVRIAGTGLLGSIQAWQLGQVTVTFPNSTVATPVTVSHNLGRTPKIVVPISMAGFGVWWSISSAGASSFTINGSWQSALNISFTTGYLVAG